jgi:hypothetical protein
VPISVLITIFPLNISNSCYLIFEFIKTVAMQMAALQCVTPSVALIWRQPIPTKYSVIQKYGLNIVSLYFKIIASDKYDVNYILLYSQLSL